MCRKYNFKSVFGCFFCYILFHSVLANALPPDIPFRIIAIRHGEKDEAGADVPLTNGIAHPTYDQTLDPQGYQRSAYLVGFF